MWQVVLSLAEMQLLFITGSSLLFTLYTFDGSDFAYQVFTVYIVFVSLSFCSYLWGEHLAVEWREREEEEKSQYRYLRLIELD